jgi:aryl-alcohol dehydrogenase-like predicted oxidoreductase
VALKWLLQKVCVASVIIGATSLKQLEENMAAGSTQWQLTDEQVINNLHVYYLEVNLLWIFFSKCNLF